MAHLKIPRSTLHSIKEDLERPHPVCPERVGFLLCRPGPYNGQGVGELLVATDYLRIPDEHYLPNKWGATITGSAMDEALSQGLRAEASIFHVHSHGGYGQPNFSPTDLREIPKVVRYFCDVMPTILHGALLFSDTSAIATIWNVGSSAIPDFGRGFSNGDFQMNERFDRQSFLGPNSEVALDAATIALIGAGGGGSHVALQTAYLGIGNLLIFDHDPVEVSNLNRLITADEEDAINQTLKVDAAHREVKLIRNACNVRGFPTKWQEQAKFLQLADIIIGCVDSANERRQLEETARQLCTPYIDIGMDVHQTERGFSMSGQVVVSIPGGPCLRCWDVINDKLLKVEAGKYGHAGGRPQVVWPNGVLASSAVGFAIDLLTGWSGETSPGIYLSYDGNRGILKRFDYEVPKDSCPHFPFSKMGAFKWE